MAKAPRPRKRPKRSECVIPTPLASSSLPRLRMRPDPEHEERRVRDYMAGQASDEKVLHVEKLASERVFDRLHDLWDVHTDRERWWVVTEPMNLYRQKDFPSADVMLSFHVGLMTRMFSRAAKDSPATRAERERLHSPWRRWEQAAEALDRAEEGEDFQAIGMRCRECLVELVQAAADPRMLQPGDESPKRGAVVPWIEIIMRTVASGSSASELRGLVRDCTKATWDYLNWLTHAKNAVRSDAHAALGATGHLLELLGGSLLRHERGTPERCPKCRSYQVTTDYRPDVSRDAPEVSLCTSCGWISPPRAA
jgi:hypothetical protein